MLAWLALCIHWFNPLVWLAYGLSEKDMEMSCDEAVIRELGPGVKKAYTTSLLAMAAGRSRLARTPVAFGEQDTGSRIRHVLRYKKPGKWMTVLLAFLCAVLAGKTRPSFMKMLRDARKKKFDLIVTREVSRFARNTRCV